jgi:hypothetical protein
MNAQLTQSFGGSWTNDDQCHVIYIDGRAVVCYPVPVSLDLVGLPLTG